MWRRGPPVRLGPDGAHGIFLLASRSDGTTAASIEHSTAQLMASLLPTGLDEPLRNRPALAGSGLALGLGSLISASQNPEASRRP